ncbi:hypothetical protein WJX74_002942 [Apatococcus lobatus]|uniref:Uncharacterized protein n=1 Tax=Apatococcus lobatus TaxID=904363 RepID=A0AAW1S9Q3_9CHLO
MGCSAVAWQPQAIAFRAPSAATEAALVPAKAGWLAQILRSSPVAVPSQLLPQSRVESTVPREDAPTIMPGIDDNFSVASLLFKAADDKTAMLVLNLQHELKQVKQSRAGLAERLHVILQHEQRANTKADHSPVVDLRNTVTRGSRLAHQGHVQSAAAIAADKAALVLAHNVAAVDSATRLADQADAQPQAQGLQPPALHSSLNQDPAAGPSLASERWVAQPHCNNASGCQLQGAMAVMQPQGSAALVCMEAGLAWSEEHPANPAPANCLLSQASPGLGSHQHGRHDPFSSSLKDPMSTGSNSAVQMQPQPSSALDQMELGGVRPSIPQGNINPSQAPSCHAGTALATPSQQHDQHGHPHKTHECINSPEPHGKHELASVLQAQSSPNDGKSGDAASAAGSQCGSAMSGLEGLVHWEANSSVSSAASLNNGP